MGAIDKLLGEFRQLRKELADTGAALGVARRDATELYERMPQEHHLHCSDDLMTQYPAFLLREDVHPEVKESARELWNLIQVLAAEMQRRGGQFARVKTQIEAESRRILDRRNQALARELSAMRDLVTRLLLPFCATQKKAHDLANQCDKIVSLQALLNEPQAWTRDVELLAERAACVESEIEQ